MDISHYIFNKITNKIIKNRLSKNNTKNRNNRLKLKSKSYLYSESSIIKKFCGPNNKIESSDIMLIKRN